MSRAHCKIVLVLSIHLMATGCMLRDRDFSFREDLAHYQNIADAVAYPDADPVSIDCDVAPLPPNSISDPSQPVPWPMTLEEAIATAIARSPVLRDLGGAIIRAPESVRTIHGPALASSDPRRGMEAALSDFDANLATGLFYENNDRMLNNFFSAGGARVLQQDLDVFRTELSKRSAAGTEIFLRSDITYDANNAVGNEFAQSYDSILETEIRQPLLQGGWGKFNRIAGPNGVPGQINGIVVARINTDVSLLDFQMGLRDLVSNVENAYWDLYFAYRDLDAKIKARDEALDTWLRIKERINYGQESEERDAQFREQYLRFEDEVQNALTGRLLDRTATFNGSSGGTFRGIGGVYTAERRLRLLLGLSINDHRLIRPLDEPTQSQIQCDWNCVMPEAMTRRCELRRQRLQVRRHELELIASRNFLLPRFDVVGRYRLRGLGKNWIGSQVPATAAPFDNTSLGNLFSGDFQEWHVGGELSFPIGFRRAHAAVRHAQLQQARAVAVLQEQERRVLHDLSNAKADLDRAYTTCRTNFSRLLAAREQLRILRDKRERDMRINLDQWIDAQRRLADADSQFHRSCAEYMIAIKNFHFEKGSLLEYSQVHLAGAAVAGADCGSGQCGPYQAASRNLLDYVLRRQPEDTDTGEELPPGPEEPLYDGSPAPEAEDELPPVGLAPPLETPLPRDGNAVFHETQAAAHFLPTAPPGLPLDNDG